MKGKIKVLWVTNALGCGGAERQMLYMYNILQKYCNFDITIMYYARVGDELNLDGVKTVYIDKAGKGKIYTIRQIAKYIKEHDIDIMHSFGGGTANIYGRLAALCNRKTVSVGAMLGKRHFAKAGIRCANSLLNLFGNWWTVNNMELVPILKRELRFVSDDRVVMLHNGFVPAEQVDYRHGEWTEYDEDKQNYVVFSVMGRLEPIKNYPLFIKAAAEIANRHDHVRFWIIGNGKESEKLKQLAQQCGVSDRIRFWGYRTDIDVALSRCDVFVQTSFTEGSPNTIAEAMRARKPIISTNSTDLSEMIIQGENGFVVENDNLSGLVEAMEAMLQKDCHQLECAGERSYELFEKYFLGKRVSAEFEAFYNKIMQK
ncbi:MAG: glycosyltransferase [Oscillospiraceae bacterium]|nr:glycosyltransferase [Oscillospiraceae bacterium]